MSYTELHTGRLKVKYRDLSIDSFKKFLDSDEGLYVEDLEDKLEDEKPFVTIQQGDWRGKYIFIYNDKILYEVLEHSDLGEADYIDITKKNEDETVDFTYLFYNGGTCFEEMLQEGLNKNY